MMSSSYVEGSIHTVLKSLVALTTEFSWKLSNPFGTSQVLLAWVKLLTKIEFSWYKSNSVWHKSNLLETNETLLAQKSNQSGTSQLHCDTTLLIQIKSIMAQIEFSAVQIESS